MRGRRVIDPVTRDGEDEVIWLMEPNRRNHAPADWVGTIVAGIPTRWICDPQPPVGKPGGDCVGYHYACAPA